VTPYLCIIVFQGLHFVITFILFCKNSKFCNINHKRQFNDYNLSVTHNAITFKANKKGKIPK